MDLLFAFRFGETALRIDEVGLDAVKSSSACANMRLAETHVRIGLAVDVRHAPVVANDD